jgi:hypothetical protein
MHASVDDVPARRAALLLFKQDVSEEHMDCLAEDKIAAAGAACFSFIVFDVRERPTVKKVVSSLLLCDRRSSILPPQLCELDRYAIAYVQGFPRLWTRLFVRSFRGMLFCEDGHTFHASKRAHVATTRPAGFLECC